MSWWNTKQTREIDLVLSSSGVRAPCFIGGIEGILEKGYEIKRIAGTSGGAILAAGYALGKTTEELRELAPNTPYKKFKDFKIRNLLSLTNPSVYTGQELDAFYQSVFGDARLRDFQIDCKISVVTIVGKERIILDKEHYPDLHVWEAVRMSSTIPFIFPYLTLNGKAVTDGSLVTDMLDIFPDGPSMKIALRPRAHHGIKKTIQDVTASRLFLWNYIKILAEFFMDAVDNQHVLETEWKNTIVIPTHTVGAFNFDIGPEEIIRLMDAGLEAVRQSELLPDLRS
jgi:NTE family protein